MIIRIYEDNDDVYSSARYQPVRLLWIRVIIRAVWDYALWKDDADVRRKKFAQDAERWLFEPSELPNSLQTLCYQLDLPINVIRATAKVLTRDQVKKLEMKERNCKDDSEFVNLLLEEKRNPDSDGDFE